MKGPPARKEKNDANFIKISGTIFNIKNIDSNRSGTLLLEINDETRFEEKNAPYHNENEMVRLQQTDFFVVQMYHLSVPGIKHTRFLRQCRVKVLVGY